eukprot:scaffold136776_cov48-Prasinocladus_malaysianus.AAC.1
MFHRDGGYAGHPSGSRWWMVAVFVLQPAALLIDHGHFQYNNIGLGLVAGAAAAISCGKDYLGSVLFCMALNHKQMTLYYAPAFFAHLFGKCLARQGWASKITGVAQLGLVVVLTFAIIWSPFLASGPEAALKDKMACITGASETRTNPKRVHEKSILLPLLPITLMAADEPYLAGLLPLVASFSMFPLLKKDGVALAYAGALVMYLGLAHQYILPTGRPLLQACSISVVTAMCTLHVLALLMPPPSSRSHALCLMPTMKYGDQTTMFSITAIYLNYQQLMLPPVKQRALIKKTE